MPKNPLYDVRDFLYMHHQISDYCIPVWKFTSTKMYVFACEPVSTIFRSVIYEKVTDIEIFPSKNKSIQSIHEYIFIFSQVNFW